MTVYRMTRPAKQTLSDKTYVAAQRYFWAHADSAGTAAAYVSFLVDALDAVAGEVDDMPAVLEEALRRRESRKHGNRNFRVIR